jgi:hypothetical protein
MMTVIIPIVVVGVVGVATVMTIRIVAIARSGYRRVIIRRAGRVVSGMQVDRRVTSRHRCVVIGCIVARRMARSSCTTGMRGTPTTTGFVTSGGIAIVCRG